jgi:hypothetical protein
MLTTRSRPVAVADEGPTRQLGEGPTLVIMRRIVYAGFAALLSSGQMSSAQQPIDIQAYFQKARDLGRDGLARKTKTVDVREASPGEVVVTVIKGEGKETQSPPAKAGDMVVRNRCPETGNEEFLVSASKFASRYEGPTGPAGEDGWLPYRPRGADMRFVVVAEADGEFSFTAPWGETMIARPGDAIVQDLQDPKDTYRVQKASFACTYEEIRPPAK